MESCQTPRALRENSMTSTAKASFSDPKNHFKLGATAVDPCLALFLVHHRQLQAAKTLLSSQIQTSRYIFCME